LDSNRFDSFSRSIASGLTRRRLIATLPGGLIAAVLAPLAAFGQNESVVNLTHTPKIKRRDGKVVVEIELSEPAECAIAFGITTQLDQHLESDTVGTEHQFEIPDLPSGTRAYFRVLLGPEGAVGESRIYKFKIPACELGYSLCGDACIADCGPNAAIDPAACACVCADGYADCDSDPASGCEAALGSIDDCLACGNSCDDGNACTEHTCDSVAGCLSAALPDGTPCGTDGACLAGVCGGCVPAGVCSLDTDCCDDEICCAGACRAKTSFADDPANCGGCGVPCPSGSCEVAICADGVCGVAAVADSEPCDDGNPCTVDDHCMAGACMGGPAEPDTICGTNGVCKESVCVECTPVEQCLADADCCAGETCCVGTCISPEAFLTDLENCGGCGNTCPPADELCREPVCVDGGCDTQPIVDGETCNPDNACVDGSVCVDGQCEGTPLEDGTECGEFGACQEGVCEEPMAFSAAAVGTVFQDSFESGGLGSWSSQTAMSVQSALVATGSFAARAKGNETVAYARKSFDTAAQEFFIRTRFQVYTQGDNSISLLRTYKSSSSPLVSVYVTRSGRIAIQNSVTGATTNSATGIVRKTWNELQLRVRVVGSQSLITVWLNGVKLSDVSKTVSLGTAGIKLVQIGENINGRTFDVIYDDFAICTGGLCPALSTLTSRAPGAADRVLLATYTINRPNTVNWSKVRYLPRRMGTGLSINDPTRGTLTVDHAGPYSKWDVFATYNYSVHRLETRSDWTVIELNRPATVGIVWRGGPSVPAWLSSWVRSGSVTISGIAYPVLRKAYGAGKVKLGAVYDPSAASGRATRDTYWVLLAESDALPSPPPAVPGTLETPIANRTCPAWVHDQYVATGPDGKIYPTWHHQIDPVYWCYHRHEHGTNPKWFGGGIKPAFGFTAGVHGMPEPHAGFKTYVLDSDDGTRWMFTHHFGTAGLARACNRFHTVDIVVKRISTDEILADLHFMGDFGRSEVNRTHVALTPPTCPNQARDARESTGVRMLPSKSDDAVGYEPWRADLKHTVFGFIASFTFNTPDAMVICNNSTCDQPITTGGTGTRRHFSANGTSDGTRFGIIAGTHSGEFYTDVHGEMIMNKSDAGAVRQYIKPGAKMQIINPAPEYYDLYAWGRKLVGDGRRGDATAREGSITAPN
jgi:hypothetical protein